MAEFFQINIHDGKNRMYKTIPFVGCDPDEVQIKIDNKVIYQGKKYKPLVVEGIRTKEVKSKKKVKNKKKKK